MNKEEKEYLQETIWNLEEYIARTEFQVWELKKLLKGSSTDRRRLYLLEVFYENAKQCTKTWEASRASRAARMLRALNYRKKTGKIEAPMSTWVN